MHAVVAEWQTRYLEGVVFQDVWVQIPSTAPFLGVIQWQVTTNIIKKKNYFGNSYIELIEFFRDYPTKGSVLDLGCGQGRDALELAKLGYDVTGVDISKIGVNQMIEDANRLNLNIKGEISDVYTYECGHSVFSSYFGLFCPYGSKTK